MKIKNTIFAFLILVALVAAPSSFAQTPLTQTTLAAAVTTTGGTVITITSATACSSGTGCLAWTPSTSSQEYDAFSDGEQMKVLGVNGTSITVQRAIGGTQGAKHNSGVMIWFAPTGKGVWMNQDPIAGGMCTSTQYTYLPVINVNARSGAATGRVWNCLGASGSQKWMRDDGFLFLPATACITTVSGNSTGTNGFTIAGASNMAVAQAQTSATGTNTHDYQCSLPAPSRLNVPSGIMLRDVTFMYGVQTTGLGTQVATLASGTMNSTTVFTYVDLPVAGASETASTVTPVRADAGTLTITPAVASFNVATTTAGAFYSAKFTPASPFSINTDLRQYFFTVALLNTATSATITNSPGILLHFAYQPL